MFRLFGRTLDCVRTAVHYYMYAILGLMMSIPGPTLIDLEHSSRTDAYGISFIYIARSTGYLIGSLTGGFVLDCMQNEELALILSSALVALGAYVIPWCRNLTVLLGTFMITGFAIGFSNTGSNASCLRIWGKKGAPILQGLHLLYGCGGLLAPLIAAPFLEEFLPSTIEIPSHGLLLNLTEALLPIPTIFSPPNITDIEPKVINEASVIPTITFAYTIIGVLATLVSGCFAFIYIFASQSKNEVKQETPAEKVKDQGVTFTVIVVILACLQTGLSSGIEVSFTQMLTSYVVSSSHGLSKSKGSYLTSAYWSAFTCTRFLSIFLACKLDIRKILAFVLVLAMSASLVLLTIGTWSVTALWVGAAMLGVSMAPVFPGILSWVERYININNRIASVFTLVSCLLEMVVPFTISLYLNSHPSVLFCFLTGATVTASILFIILNIILSRKGEKYETSGEQEHKMEKLSTAV